jgi:urate oxidase
LRPGADPAVSLTAACASLTPDGNSYTQADNTVVVATDSSAPLPTISYNYDALSDQTIILTYKRVR